NRDLSRYQTFNGPWSDQPDPGPPGSTTSSVWTNLDNLAYAFVSSPAPPGAQRGDNTLGVADMLLGYMTAYSSWSTMTPCFSYEGMGNNNKVPENVILQQVVGCFGNPGQAKGGCQIVP